MFLAMVLEDQVLVSQKTHSENNFTPTLMYKCNYSFLGRDMTHLIFTRYILFFPNVKDAYLSERLLHGLYFPSFLSRLPSR